VTSAGSRKQPRTRERPTSSSRKRRTGSTPCARVSRAPGRGASPHSNGWHRWLAPPYVGGHWIPQLIELAGGIDPLGLPGEKSRTASWDEVAATEPEVVMVMPCGFGVGAAADEALDHHDRLAALGAERIVAVDASSFFSRPSPRLVDGLEILAHAVHPDRMPELHPGTAAVVG
jgi:iron complex transport system substrate-binding protein